MASVYKQSGGRYAIQVGAGNARTTKRLGKLSRAGAAALRHHVGVIETCRATATVVPATTTDWLDELTDELHARLAAVGLVTARSAIGHGIPTTIGTLWDDHLARRPDLRPFTRANLVQTKLRGVAFFGLRPVAAITHAEAKDFRRWLAATYAPATVSGFIAKTRTLFNDAIDRGLLASNPFRNVKGGSQVNAERRHYVTRETIDRVIAACPHDGWKLLIALGRYGGLRVPSEAVGLRIDGVDFAAGRITVRSPKTEKQGKPSRVIPLWPELVPLLKRVIAAAGPDQVRLLPFVRGDYNPHTQFVRLIERAGERPWPKVWQNLRSTRETELLAEGHPLHVVCAWIGNTERVASKHYLQVTAADFDKATGRAAAASAAQSAAPTRDDKGQLRRHEMQKPRFPHHECGNAVVETYPIAPDRVRTIRKTQRRGDDSPPGAAKSAARRTRSGPRDPRAEAEIHRRLGRVSAVMGSARPREGGAR